MRSFGAYFHWFFEVNLIEPTQRFLKLFYEELTFQCENQNCKHIWSLRPLSHFEGYFEVIVRSI